MTERPRYGHSLRSKKTRLRVRRWDRERFFDGKDGLDGPKRIPSSPLRQFGGHRKASRFKDFSDRLGPLRRFLRSRVGQPWDQVYSELARHLPKNTLTGRHIWTHVRQEVRRNCVIGPDGRIYDRPECLFTDQVHGLYVHPTTGLLCYRPWSWKKYRLGQYQD
ncbi:MAG TPA: hypothetical protein VFK07_03630 [Candidatus Paceibacterota bacterium]|nr:hypothetical protein [Candidatus Paceibacterota bacterium]